MENPYDNKTYIFPHQQMIMKNVQNIIDKSDTNINMIGNDSNEVIQEHLDSLLHKYLVDLEQSMKGSNFIFDCIS